MKYDIVNSQLVMCRGYQAIVRGVFTGCVCVEWLEGPREGDMLDIDEDELAKENDLIEL